MPGVAAVRVAGPVCINRRVAPAGGHARLGDILRAGTAYGDGDLGQEQGQGQAVNVEYVSANPTGPLTVGHARGEVVGDALSALLAKVGYKVTREYYVNDAGGQVDTLPRSAYLRYREALGVAIGAIPSGLYPGDHLKDVGAALAARDGHKWHNAPAAEWLSSEEHTSELQSLMRTS